VTTYNYGDKVIFTHESKEAPNLECVTVDGFESGNIFAAEVFFGTIEEYERLVRLGRWMLVNNQTTYAYPHELTKIGASE